MGTVTFNGALSLFCLVMTGCVAAWGIFSRHFDDSLTQRAGLTIIALACLLRVPGKLAMTYTPPELLMAQIGLCVYAVGTAIKFWRQSHSGRRHQQRRQHDRRALGGGI